MYRIFIVEDDRTIAQAVAHLAESWGLEVRCVRDFRAVTAEAAEFQPHLIILDIALPCFDGYHWCRELRKQTSAPILFLSSLYWISPCRALTAITGAGSCGSRPVRPSCFCPRPVIT